MKNIYLLITIFIVTSCATTSDSSLNYLTPNSVKIQNEKIIDKEFNELWDNLVGDLSKTFYVINNIDKQSRLLNVSFRVTNNISDYVDCGVSERKFSLASKVENTSYKVADPSSYFYEFPTQTSLPNTQYAEIFRIPSLEGRANIYVAPSDKGTKVSINTRYTWSIRNEYTPYLYMPLYDSHRKSSERKRDDGIIEPISFNTNQTSMESPGGVVCSSTGKFENDILDLI